MPLPSIPSAPSVSGILSSLTYRGGVRKQGAAGGGGGPAIAAPSAYWKLDSQSATVWADSASGGFPLTSLASTATATGLIGNAWDNSAKTQPLYLSSATAGWSTAFGDLSIADWSWCGWFQPRTALPNGSTTFDDLGSYNITTTPNRAVFVARLTDATNWHGYYTTTAGNGTNFTLIGGSSITTPTPALNTWFFAMVRYNATTKDIQFSINAGTLKTSNLGAGALWNGTCDFTLGSMFQALPEAGQGYFDETGWWKGHCLTDAEVALLYNGGAGRTFGSGVWT